VCVCSRERERERERKKQRETEREGERKRGREGGREGGRERDLSGEVVERRLRLLHLLAQLPPPPLSQSLTRRI
jgi:hypothetical protein